MLSPLIPDIMHPKWIMAVKILEIIASPRAKKIAGRLKISDIDNFLLSIKFVESQKLGIYIPVHSDMVWAKAEETKF